MTARTNVEAANAYVSKCGSSLDGHDVNVVAFLQIAQALDKATSGALLAEYRRFYALLEEARTGGNTPKQDEAAEDDLLSPSR